MSRANFAPRLLDCFAGLLSSGTSEYYFHQLVRNFLLQSTTNLTPSLTCAKKEVQDAIEASASVDALMCVITWLTHPAQYHASVAALKGIKLLNHEDRLCKHLDAWTSIFSGYTFVTNRPTALHRDTNGFKAGFDYLTVSGSAKSILTLPDLNVECAYDPGTVVAIAGRVLRHAVEKKGPGDRICVARWVRERVLLKYGMGPSPEDLPWPKLSYFMEQLEMCLVPH
jgi:hypothetical protein